MRCFYRSVVVAVSLLLAACGGGGGGGGGSVTVTPPPADNVATITVNGGLNGNVNQAFVTIQVCAPGSSTQCRTFDNVLIDTGSVGLRLIGSPSDLSTADRVLPAVTDNNGNPLAECVEFVDNSHAWGPLRLADIKIVGETANSVPVQLITSASTVGAEPSTCGNGDTTTNVSTTQKLGGNGILGIGHFQQDCGAGCASITNNGFYYACSGTTCTPSTAILTQQLQNPIAHFSQDNNGSIIQLPAISSSGAPSVNGQLIFGINTRSNNALGSANPQYIQNNGRIWTTFNGVSYPSSFIDSGSNGLYFPNVSQPTITECSGRLANTQFYCPPSTISRSATIFGTSPSASVNVSFNVANAESLGNFDAFNDLAGRYDNGFDWGLPFFYGRNVYTAIEGMPGISAPYVAF